MDKGNVNKHRDTYSSGIKAVEEQKWGRDCARERYGSLKQVNMKPPEDCYPQFEQDQRADKTYGDVPNSWLRAAGESGKPRR